MYTEKAEKYIRNIVSAAAAGLLLCVLCAGAAFAAPGSPFPFDIDFSVEDCSRICYAGHPHRTVMYQDGQAVTPDTTFRIISKNDGPADGDLAGLSITISLLYENDTHSGSFKETVKQYDEGDLNYSDDFRILSDTVATSLEERSRLFSDSLCGMEMTVISRGRDQKKKTIYLYVCSDEDYSTYLDNSPSAYESDEPDTPDDTE